MSWQEEAKTLRFEQNKSWTETAKAVAHYFPELNGQQVWEKVRGALRKTEQYKTKGKITFEDKKEPTIEDIDEYYEQLKKTNSAIMRLESKQTKTTIHIDDDKPIGIAFWGDWHLGAKGIDYEQFDKDVELIKNTDGLYVIGMGDYKDNGSALVHPSSTQETIAQTDLQDKIVQRIFERTAERHIVTIRGCHDDWDKRNSNKDFIQSLCDITNAVNLWHGGIINLTAGNTEHRIGARHKYKGESSLNTTNTQRTFVNEFGHCSIVGAAHKHFAELQHTVRMGEETIYLRSGGYKRYDEHGQKLAGYEAGLGVPVVILTPDRKDMIPVKRLESAAELLYKLR